MSRRRQLSDEDRALWSGFARSIKPLRGDAKAATAVPSTVDPLLPPPKPRAAAPRDMTATATKPTPLASLSRRQRQRVARGREPIEARIDLHGMTQIEAHAALLRFLRRAQADEARIALVVTGKGSRAKPGDGAHERGVLRRQVPMWLALPEFRPLVVGFEDAGAAHGGQGALYVRLRRAR